jgi:NADPH-dependent 2,4-dienoyl-CoA reductase/sulfur reductase-like enzyme
MKLEKALDFMPVLVGVAPFILLYVAWKLAFSVYYTVTAGYTSMLFGMIIFGLAKGVWDYYTVKPLTCRERPDTIIIGGGLGGILAGIKLQKAGINFKIIEKSGDYGGTWNDNTYPGAACDVPGHLYSYSFEHNPYWT